MYYDLYPLKHETIGGNKWVLFGTESPCGFMTIGFCKRKTTELCYKMISESVAELNQYGLMVGCAVFDDEATLVSTFPSLKRIGIKPSTYPAGMKNRMIERKIREVKDKRRCMKASLTYLLPDKL